MADPLPPLPPGITENDVIEGGRKLKRSVLLHSLGPTLLIIVMALSGWVGHKWLWIGGSVIFQVVMLPISLRIISNGMNNQIDRIRERDGLTPRSQLPNVGV